jgi:D-beta-D-heptose 7-phosphate kinase/D-beta-D-heptose 1-phosphate adenosyltransferase
MSQHILVIGDAMIDRYHVGTASRLSPEAPIPVVKQREVIESPGGAYNVLENLRALGCNATGVFQSVRPLKSRLMVGDTQLARWDVDKCDAISEAELRVFVSYIMTPTYGLVVSDYGKGAITESLREYLVDTFYGTPAFIDTKGNPIRWKGLRTSIFFPNEVEYSTYRDEYDTLPVVVRKESEGGMSLVSYGRQVYHVPSHPVLVRCVNGAGDSAMAGFVAEWCRPGTPMDRVLRFSNACGAVAVSKPYTAIVTREEAEALLGT